MVSIAFLFFFAFSFHLCLQSVWFLLNNSALVRIYGGACLSRIAGCSPVRVAYLLWRSGSGWLGNDKLLSLLAGFCLVAP